MLVGKNADAIVPDLQAASDVAFVAPPAVASAQAFRRGPEPEVAPRAVTIPFPTALHLFIPGAALALYAARKMSPRYRRRYRPA